MNSGMRRSFAPPDPSTLLRAGSPFGYAQAGEGGCPDMRIATY